MYSVYIVSGVYVIIIIIESIPRRDFQYLFTINTYLQLIN